LQRLEDGFAGFLIITTIIYFALQYSSEINSQALDTIYGGVVLLNNLCLILIRYIKYKKTSKYLMVLTSLICIVLFLKY